MACWQGVYVSSRLQRSVTNLHPTVTQASCMCVGVCWALMLQFQCGNLLLLLLLWYVAVGLTDSIGSQGYVISCRQCGRVGS
jgi:hypothetical protein